MSERKILNHESLSERQIFNHDSLSERQIFNHDSVSERQILNHNSPCQKGRFGITTLCVSKADFESQLSVSGRQILNHNNNYFPLTTEYYILILQSIDDFISIQIL